MTRAISANRHDYKPGDVLSAVWGYEQTNVDYYEVTAITPGTVTVRKIASEKKWQYVGPLRADAWRVYRRAHDAPPIVSRSQD